MPKIPYNQFNGTAQRAREVFLEEFDEALAIADPESQWAVELGFYLESDAILTTFPVPVSSAGYVRREGDDRYRSLYQRSVSFTPEEWQDGFSARKREIEAPSFIGWHGEPMRMATEKARHLNVLTAAMLEGSVNLGFYSDPKIGLVSTKSLFDDAHPLNVFDSTVGTFDNAQTGSAIDQTLVKAVKQRFYNRLGPNGQRMGLMVTHVIVPSARAEEAKDFFEQDMLIETIENAAGTDNVAAVMQKNRHKGTVTLIVAPELSDDDDIYFLDARPQAPKAWVVQMGGEEDIYFDESSDFFKETGELKIGKIHMASTAGLLPHAIERVTLS
jgi:hypothetical protein